jgi:hypothetical protein
LRAENSQLETEILRNRLKTRELASKPQKVAFFDENGGMGKERQFRHYSLETPLGQV